MENTMYQLILQFPLLLFSITVHEYSHGFIAEKRGDDTARVLGRLTLNPIAHIDLMGTVLFPLIAIMFKAPVFGWAKPVPVNPNMFENPRRDMMFVGIAGPLSNFILAVASALLLWGIRSFRLLGYTQSAMTVMVVLHYLLVINVVLAVFNLIPVPPLDGSHILSGLLPREAAYEYEKITPYGFFIMIFLLATGVLWSVLGPVVGLLIGLLGG